MKRNVFSLIALIFAVSLLFIACKPEPEPEPHKHEFSTTWTSDAENHWHDAICGHEDQISDKAAHIWDAGTVTTEPTETTEGVKTFKCTVCEKTKTEEIAKLSHTHKYSEEWYFDASEHWHSCPGCKEKGSAANHIWDEGEITKKATKTADGVKTFKCTICGATKEETVAYVPETDKTPEPEPEIEANKYPDDENPIYDASPSTSLDFIFNTDSIGFTTITIRRSEWNKMLSYYDYFYKNENNVLVESYEYKKDGMSWKLNDVGIRLRGNTSRFRPQGKDYPKDECGYTKPNAEWSTDYYNYAATCSDDDYRQSHFKVDFEPLKGDDRKMSDCMKGVALKRSDELFSKEIFCYHLFHQYGIWTAPRASQTKVYINIYEDANTDGTIIEDTSLCDLTKLDFGVYEMFEEVNKQSLKSRMAKKGNNSAENAWKNNEGDLWKCGGGDLTLSKNSSQYFGCEQVEILNTDKDKSLWEKVWTRDICYDLKTNKSSVDAATVKFQGFISELNSLSITDASSDVGIKVRKDFYEKWFDVDFFIKTYAVNILVGMDDDYWGNKNNYYLYFDNGKNGSGKCYFIPFDYDNTLGSSINRDKVYVNPLEWGWNENNGELTKGDRPLLDRLIEVPEYKQKFINALLEVSSQDSDSPWNKDNCIALWRKWHAQIADYVATPDIRQAPNIGSTSIGDSGGWKGTKHYLTQDYNNIYEQTSFNYRYWLTSGDFKVTFDLNGGSISGNESSVITKDFEGNNSDLNFILGETPYYREGYILKGWTKTKNGNDFISSYSGQENLTVYAAWMNITDATELTIYQIKDSNYKGIKIGIVNLPNDHFRRKFYINGKEVGGDAADDDGRNGKYVTYPNLWEYPFTEQGKLYEIKVKYENEGYSAVGESNTIYIKAESGKGEFKVVNTPEFIIQENKLIWKTAPSVQIGNGITPRVDDNWEEYFLLEINTPDWFYVKWKYLGASNGENFDFKACVEEVLGEAKAKNDPDKQADILRLEAILAGNSEIRFSFKYKYNYSNLLGNLSMTIFDYDEVTPFKITN